MKYGQKLRAVSVPQWSAYNVDYNELKHLIKDKTAKDAGQARVIPGQVDPDLAHFEEVFFHELSNQHDRVDLFVKDKVGAIGRKLRHTGKNVTLCLSQLDGSGSSTPSRRPRHRKLAKYDNSVTKCDSELKDLQRFIYAQTEAFRKILKKYKKWTGSDRLGERFRHEILSNPKSFTKRDLNPLLAECDNLLSAIRAVTPEISEPSTPTDRESRRSSVQMAKPSAPQRYWNEYDDGSEREDEGYIEYVEQDDESSFPGANSLSKVIIGVKAPLEKVLSAWFGRRKQEGDQRPLLGNLSFPSSSASNTETDDEAASSDFPPGYATHYATFPSVRDQKSSQSRERVLFYGTIGGLAAALLLLAIASLLIATGKHKLRVEVDAGVIVGMVASLFFATLGLGSMLCRQQRLSVLQNAVVWVTFMLICVVNGILLVLVAGNTEK